MVQVIGKSKEHQLETVCRNCSSILRYTRSEVKECIESDYSGDKEYVHYITCPECNFKIRVKQK